MWPLEGAGDILAVVPLPIGVYSLIREKSIKDLIEKTRITRGTD